MTTDPNVADPVKLAAIKDALDRSGLAAKTAVSVEVGVKPFEMVFDSIMAGPRDARPALAIEGENAPAIEPNGEILGEFDDDERDSKSNGSGNPPTLSTWKSWTLGTPTHNSGVPPPHPAAVRCSPIHHAACTAGPMSKSRSVSVDSETTSSTPKQPHAPTQHPPTHPHHPTISSRSSLHPPATTRVWR